MENHPLFYLPEKVETRWASAENYDALAGAGGKEKFGRKGSPGRALAAGERFVAAQGDGTGTVRRMWFTATDRSPQALRGLVIRMYWDGEEKPAVEAPLGDFFGLALGRTAVFENAWFDSPEGRSFSWRLPMPFQDGFEITVTNESPTDLDMLFYDVEFTLGDEHGREAGYFHAHYRLENPTTLRRDFEILPRVEGRGRYLGCNIGVIVDTARYGDAWWGEGEAKIYLDGDGENPTLCGTGTEDYIGTAWGVGQYGHLWHGCPIADEDRMQYAFYRLHGPDPVYFHRDIRVTIQQIGAYEKCAMIDHMKKTGLRELVAAGDGSGRITLQDLEREETPRWAAFEREDDWCATAYFYLDRPVNELPAIDPYEVRVAGLTGDEDPQVRQDI